MIVREWLDLKTINHDMADIIIKYDDIGMTLVMT